jgi:hypothetical protein
MGERSVINELLISHHQKTKQKAICYMIKSLIGDGLPIGDGLFYPTWIKVCSHSRYNVTEALGHY